MPQPVLEVKNLVTSFRVGASWLRAVENVSFSIAEGEILGLVGESGSGKSVMSLSVMRLIRTPPGRIEQGEILFKGTNLLTLPESELRRIRGNRISMIFQEPMSSLNPVFSIGSQIAEVFRIHKGLSRKEARNQAIEMLQLVQIPAAEKRVDDYPHQLSGGMRQRVMIAMALACRPELLIADEPTTALDVTIQAQILRLILELREKFGMAVLLITHDMGVVAELCDRVEVMYGGHIAERGSVQDIFDRASHPYTRGLLESIPRLQHKCEELPSIPGFVPSLDKMPVGCRFRNRCGLAQEKCAQLPPPIALGLGHEANCWNLSSP
ncbi:MAG: ABC transporter ATP-binding protein [Zetaproteobacteria bacterium]|nr:ABC transporter ATP-binding protein [Zetaproteobacteria bacterium]